MKPKWKRELFGLAVLALMAVAAIYYYPLIPNPMPSHFDIHGNPNGWMPKITFFLVMATISIFVYLLLTFLPIIDPLKKKIELKFKTVLFLRDAILAFFAVIFFLTLQAARVGMLNADLFGIALGIFLVLLGNYMPKIPQNWFLGIRTPWTVSSEVVWKKTHILGGWLFMLSGVAFLFCALLKVNTIIPLSAILISALISVLYSFFLYKKIERADGDRGSKL